MQRTVFPICAFSWTRGAFFSGAPVHLGCDILRTRLPGAVEHGSQTDLLFLSCEATPPNTLKLAPLVQLFVNVVSLVSTEFLAAKESFSSHSYLFTHGRHVDASVVASQVLHP